MVTLGQHTLYNGWGKDVLPLLAADSIDSVVTDPPYGLSKEPNMVEVLTHWLVGDDYTHSGNGFMGKSWDSFVPGPATWREVYRVLKPGGYALVFAGSRTVDLMAVSLRLAGFEIRDQIQWVYGSGFPKSLDVSNALDKKAGVEREVVGVPATPEALQWQGWGTALKPAHEPIIVCRKPLGCQTVAANVLMYGTGGLNIDRCRVEMHGEVVKIVQGQSTAQQNGDMYAGKDQRDKSSFESYALGRWPANLITDGSDEVLALFPDGQKDGVHVGHNRDGDQISNKIFSARNKDTRDIGYGGGGSAARFFYCAKASKSDRGEGNNHPTVKPQALMRYLVRLVTPPGGTVLDSFAGSGSTGVACEAEGFKSVLVEQCPESFNVICGRVYGAQC